MVMKLPLIKHRKTSAGEAPEKLNIIFIPIAEMTPKSGNCHDSPANLSFSNGVSVGKPAISSGCI